MKYLALLILFSGAMLLTGCGKKPVDHRAILRFKTEPDKATVTVMNRDIGQTPNGCKVQPGNYLVKISKENYEPVWIMANLKPSEEKNITLKLVPYTTSVLFQTEPSGAAVTIDGKFAGETPFVMKNLKLGNHKLSLKLPGHSAQTDTLSISSPRPKKFTRQLESNMGTLEVTSEPDDTMISLNGTPSGKTPFKATLEQGKYSVTVKKGGFSTFEQTVLITKGKSSKLNAKLEPLPGAIALNTNPEGASIRINGKDYGRTPTKIDQLQPGNYQVELSANGYDSMNISIALPAGQTVTRNLTLNSNTGGLDLVTYPAGVKIYIDGKEQGTSLADPKNPSYSKVFQIRNLSPGKHRLTMAHKRARPNTVNVTVEITKGKVERLDNLTMWIANATLKMKDGTVYTGRLIAKLANGEVKFDLQPGISMNFKPGEIESVTPINEQE